MNKKQISLPIVVLCLLGGGLTLNMDSSALPELLSPDAQYPVSSAQQTCPTTPANRESCAGVIPSGCSVFTISKGEQVFLGGNDDFYEPDSYYWVDPGNDQEYGVIWVGTPDNVQQGVNDKGLAYDGNGLPKVDVNPHLERQPVSGGYTNYPIQILRENATVEEVITWVDTHQRFPYMHDQLQFADASGDAVIISAGGDGEMVFTRKTKGDGFLVSTNFNVANPANHYGYPCWRYQKAQKLLSELVNQPGELTVQDAANVLDAIHVEDKRSFTRESMVADLTNGIVYLYYFYQFDEPIVLNVAEEIASNRPGGPLSDLFPEHVQQEAVRRYQNILSRQRSYEAVGKVWLGLVMGSLIILFIGSVNHRIGMVFWVPVVLILGPLGLLIWLAAGRRRRSSTWQAILVEAAGDLTPTTVVFFAIVVGIVLIPGLSNSFLYPLLLYFSLPLLVGWLIIQGPLLALASHKSYLLTLRQRLPHTWVVANLGIAGIFALAAPLLESSIQFSQSPWVLVAWWGFTIIGALAALLLLFLYEGWSVARGHRGWSILAWGEGEFRSARWRKLWWWIPLSYGMVIGGIAAYAYFQQIIT